MPKKKKKFIDKKNSVTFSLVHRSQRDPLIANDDVGTRVLLPINEREARKEEERKFGVFYEDEYNYLQHLRDANEISELEPIERIRISKSDKPKPSTSKKSEKKDGDREEDGEEEEEEDETETEEKKTKSNITLPSSVFGSEVQAKTGMLNKAAPRKGPLIEWDPDIVAGLDDDFDFDDEDNLLDDDFITKANAPVEGEENMEGEENKEDDSGSDFETDEDDMFSENDDFDGEENLDKEETKSRFTNYSMTSSVIRRNEGLTLLDDRFEKFYEQYYEEEIGALDTEDIDGSISTKSALMKEILKDFQKDRKEKNKKLREIVDEKEILINEDDVDSEKEDDMMDLTIEEPKEKWDCESILSTYSNLYNHPKMISEPKKDGKIKLTSRLGIPQGSLGLPGLTRKQIEKEMRESRKADTASTYRPKGETTEEKKARKQAVKDERKVRRAEKKINKQAFNSEKLRQEKEIVNLQKNVQGIKMA
ncbi:hypothetical protein LOTGIDRAFT_157842 [Lottia gigantea]|uniref:Protein LTV1 homolog n=1 Tax=Lottia gigantea TaxID=225164 RepID=V4AZL7_LOTGI|nr:hypothetical protein LOTGIDRAFT_157842 [Lottia gigantea]ESP00566.1 hypothetical protein LOTGIDRAFT_157842 [Lottia gigantea]